MNPSKVSTTSGKLLKTLVDNAQKTAKFSTSQCAQFSFRSFNDPTGGEADEFEVNKQVLRKLERLSMLTFQDDDKYIKFFKSNLKFVDKLSELDTSNVEPMYTVHENAELFMREDHAEPQMVEGTLQNASEHFEGYFVVPTGNISLHSEFEVKKDR